MANEKTADFFDEYQKMDPAALLELIAAVENASMSSADRIELNRIKAEARKRIKSKPHYLGHDE